MMTSVERTMTLAENEVPSWRVVQTKRYKERAAQRYLSELGLVTYLPLLLQWPRPAVGAEVVTPGGDVVRAGPGGDFESAKRVERR